MTKTYSHLTPAQRYQIAALKKAGLIQSEIATQIGVHKSTISRELKRNMPQRGKGAKVYDAAKAQAKTDQRHRTKRKRRLFSDELKADVLRRLRVDRWSPELISAVWKKQKQKNRVSHETIYRYIWHGKFSNKKQHRSFKKAYTLLRHGRRHRKRGNYKDSRGNIPNRVSIEQRPAAVNKRKRAGDIEADLIIGKAHQGALLVTLDRATLKTTIDKVKTKKPKEIKRVIIKRMKGKPYLKTMTFDNDQAFSLHEDIARELNIKTYFTRPYTSQDKGSIENRNGVIRRFFPKKTDFTQVTAADVKQAEQLINDRPVRKFGYKTANELHLQKTKRCTY